MPILNKCDICGGIKWCLKNKGRKGRYPWYARKLCVLEQTVTKYKLEPKKEL